MYKQLGCVQNSAVGVSRALSIEKLLENEPHRGSDTGDTLSVVSWFCFITWFSSVHWPSLERAKPTKDCWKRSKNLINRKISKFYIEAMPNFFFNSKKNGKKYFFKNQKSENFDRKNDFFKNVDFFGNFDFFEIFTKKKTFLQLFFSIEKK